MSTNQVGSAPAWTGKLPKLACPSDEAPLRWQDPAGTRLQCTSCHREYPVVNGVPILIDESKSLFDTEVLLVPPATKGVARNWKTTIRSVIPGITENAGAADRIRRFLKLLDGIETPHILIVGGGEVGAGLEEFIDDARYVFTELDVYWGDRVNVLADAHSLPFEAATFDAIICQAVLEHVVNPTRCVEEMWRVLKPGGRIFLDLPFLWPVHMGAYDYTRFTLTGLRLLARGFDEVESGVSAGPAQTLALAIHHFVRCLSYAKIWTAVVSWILPFVIFWLKYVDRVVAPRLPASDAAAGLYFVGTRTPASRTDREIIRSYWRFKQMGRQGIQ